MINTVNSFEVKAFLNEGLVLNEKNEIKQEVLDALGVSSNVKMSVAYLDNNLNLNKEGWNVRVRKKETSSKHEFDFKKRYSNLEVNQALEQSAQDGFLNNVFEAEIDKGFSKETLSYSFEKKGKYTLNDNLSLPAIKDSIKFSISNSPDLFKNWSESSWGITNLENSRYYGPVDVTRHIGEFFTNKLNLEIWTIINEDKTGFEYVVEASIKTTNKDDATLLHQQLNQFLNKKGWLLEQDKMKTQIILERY